MLFVICLIENNNTQDFWLCDEERQIFPKYKHVMMMMMMMIHN